MEHLDTEGKLFRRSLPSEEERLKLAAIYISKISYSVNPKPVEIV